MLATLQVKTVVLPGHRIEIQAPELPIGQEATVFIVLVSTGNVPFVHQNLEKIILGILFVSMIPAFIAAFRGYRSRKRAPQEESDPVPLPE